MRKVLFIMLVAITAVGCTPSSPAETIGSAAGKADLSAEDRLLEIDGLTASFFDKELKESTQAEADSLAIVLESRLVSFVAAYASHDKSPDYLERAAQLSRRNKEYEQGMQYYDQIIKDYPEYRNIVDILFTKAFVYDNELKDKEAAREAYELVAKQYPETKFGQDAKTCLSIMHMSDEELIEQFEKLNGIGSD